jgi:DNA ligase-1
LGAILVRYKDGNIVKVGSGFTDWLREEIWKNQRKYLDDICEIQYFEETTNQDGGISLRFPIFKDFRTDKLEADF